MRFTEFLKEDTTSLAASLQPFKKNIKTILKQQKYFYRIQTHGKFKTDKKSGMSWSVIPERNAPRNSLSGNNMMMYISTTWKNVPDRSMSYYSSQRRDSFGESDQHLIIPADSIKKFGFSQEDFNFDDRTTTRSTPMVIICAIADVYEAFRALPIDHPDSSHINTILNKLSKQFNVNRRKQMSIERMPLAMISSLFKFIDAIYLSYDELNRDKSSASTSSSANYFMHTLTDLRELIESEGHSSISEALESITAASWGVVGYNSLAAIPISDTQDNEMWWKGSYLAIKIASGDSPDALMSKIYEMLE